MYERIAASALRRDERIALRESIGIKSDMSPSDFSAMIDKMSDVGVLVFTGRDDLAQDGPVGMEHARELVSEFQLLREARRRSPTTAGLSSSFA